MNDEILFHQALERPAQERAVFLNEACAGDEALRARVEALLQAHDNPGSFLGAPPVNIPETMDSEPDAAPNIAGRPSGGQDTAGGEESGRVIGRYKLLQQIGEGGMGTVFLAEQTHPVQRQVALKIIKTGMDSRPVIARFEAERQALALMDHPNIARVLDAGTTEGGQPYFVMELVKGVPITRYCDEHHLTPRERLELFVPVCQAVQHAHQKGIIHRDLKPSNVMVCLYDGKPVPKVIDFGVAKATGARLTERTLFTEIGSVVGTLEYMSPEQAELHQLDIDTRSDLYSLGVLLYELLTGTTPLERNRFKVVAFLEVLRLIREEESPRPSTRLSTVEGLPSIAANRGLEPKKLSGLVRGELDWIVMKALEKDRNRRYETANGFAMDVQRYLADEPVQACPPSGWYRFRKFSRRNKAALTTAALLFATLLLGTGISTWQAIRARAAEHLAEQRLTAEREAQSALDGARSQQEKERTRVNGELSKALMDAVRLRKEAKTANRGGGDPWARLRELSRRAEALADNELADASMAQQVQALLRELKEEESDRRMIARLEEIRLGPFGGTDLRVVGGDPASPYAAAFQDYGLPVFKLSVDEAARRIAASPIRDHLMAALDDWANNSDDFCRNQLMPIGKRVYDAPWPRQYFEARGGHDRQALMRLAQQPEALAQPPGIIVQLALWSAGSHTSNPTSVELLKQAQSRYPADLMINFHLPNFLRHLPSTTADEMVGFQRAALAVRPESPFLHINLAWALIEANRFDEAIGVCRQAVQLRPDYAYAYYSLATSLLNKNRFDEAITACEEAIRLRPHQPHFYELLIGVLDRKGAPPEVVARYLPGLQEAARHASDGAAFRSLAYVLAKWGNVEDAVAAFAESIRLSPDDPEPLEKLYEFLKKKGRLEQTIAGWREAIRRRKPDDLGTLYLLSFVLEKSGRLQEAIIVWQDAVRAKPHPGAYARLGRVLAVAERVDEATAACREAIRLEPYPGQQIEAHFELAKALEKTGQLEKAIAAYREIFRINPGYGLEVQEPLSRVLAKAGRLDEAIDAYGEVIRLRSDANSHLTAGQNFKESGRPEMAIVVYRALIRSKPGLDEAHVRLADLLIAAGKVDEAIHLKSDFAWAVQVENQLTQQRMLVRGIAACQEGIRHRPDEVILHMVHSLALFRQGQQTKAVAAFSEWIRLQPRSWEPLLRRGLLYLGLGQADKALADYSRAIKLVPESAQLRGERARAYETLGRPIEALADYCKATELAPTSPFFWSERAGFYFRSKQWDKALADYSKAVELTPADAGLWRLRAGTYEQQGRLDKALADYSKAVELAPNNPDSWWERGQLHSRLRQWDPALADFCKVIEIDPNHLPALTTRAEHYVRAGRNVEAWADYEKAMKIAPASAMACNNLAWFLATCFEFKLRDPGRVVEIAAKAVALAPREGRYQNTLGAAHYRAGDWKAAVEDLTRSMAMRGGGDSHDWFFLAMAQWQFGNKAEAKKKYDQAVKWMEKNRPKDEELGRFRAEAAAVLGLEKDGAAKKRK